ncbi:MAG: hypothetical protein IPK93_03635 [Solirubrobacterales bacterium]|nr:hypothetical protein [Solirubrobacterales bacterium]
MLRSESLLWPDEQMMTDGDCHGRIRAVVEVSGRRAAEALITPLVVGVSVHLGARGDWIEVRDRIDRQRN